MTPYFSYPNIDPIAFSAGPLDIRWYSLAYMAAFIFGWRYCMYLAGLDKGRKPTPEHVDNYLIWAVLGVILGGRVGYVLFYNFAEYLQSPLEALKIWQGGMSFHGGLLGVVITILIYSRKHGFPALRLGDYASCAAPIGLFFGRIANFINGELYGRVTTDSPWGMVFPRGGDLPRYPSQLLEALFEGLVLFILLAVFAHIPSLRKKEGFMFGVLLAFYGTARFFIEYFREPDAQLGFVFAHLSMGQILCLPMILIGVIITILALLGKTSHTEESDGR